MKASSYVLLKILNVMSLATVRNEDFGEILLEIINGKLGDSSVEIVLEILVQTCSKRSRSYVELQVEL
jgi:hypothetical protein